MTGPETSDPPEVLEQLGAVDRFADGDEGGEGGEVAVVDPLATSEHAPRGTRPRVAPLTPRCRWCGRPLPEHPGPGRPRQYCRPGCRQQAYLARRLSAAHGLGDGEVIVSRHALDDLHDRLYCLQAAIEDVERDLAFSGEPRDVVEALAWLLDNARPAAEGWLEPRTAEP